MIRHTWLIPLRMLLPPFHAESGFSRSGLPCLSMTKTVDQASWFLLRSSESMSKECMGCESTDFARQTFGSAAMLAANLCEVRSYQPHARSRSMQYNRYTMAVSSRYIVMMYTVVSNIQIPVLNTHHTVAHEVRRSLRCRYPPYCWSCDTDSAFIHPGQTV